MPNLFMLVLWASVVFVAWVGHAFLWTSLLNYLYAYPLPKLFLKPWRLLTGAIILGFPFIAAQSELWGYLNLGETTASSTFVLLTSMYCLIALLVGGLIYPVINIQRLLRQPPQCLVSETTRTLDLRAVLGPEVIGNGKWAWAGHLRFNCIFKVDLTELTVAIPKLPEALDGLRILLLSDLHFHGTPSQGFFERIFAELASTPRPDMICLAGDYLDTDQHHAWIQPLLGKLEANDGKFAILGNHDAHHEPDKVREELLAAGYHVLGNDWREIAIRGQKCLLIGNERPWFRKPIDLTKAPSDGFRICISHSPDQLYWAAKHGVSLILCGHVHGGQIRLPFLTSMFVPSKYGRRFDMGVFEYRETVMVVGRGLSGKEAMRFRCHPQVIQMTLKCS